MTDVKISEYFSRNGSNTSTVVEKEDNRYYVSYKQGDKQVGEEMFHCLEMAEMVAENWVLRHE